MIERDITTIVNSAENQRVQGNFVKAITLAREHSQINTTEISELTWKQLTSFMQLWRILTVSLMSLANGKWNGNEAAKLLLEARDVFRTYYNHLCVKLAASEMKTAPAETEYQILEILAEMYRDQGNWWQRWARLTGIARYLEKAIDCYDKAAQAAIEGSSAWGVATMEREIAKRQRGEKIDWNAFSCAYRKVVELAPQTGGWDRKAAVSWWYLREAILAGRLEGIKEGFNNLLSACQEGKTSWIKYPLKELIQLVFSKVRENTYTGYEDPDLAALTTRT